MEFIDTHCHLDFSQFDSDRAAVIARAQDAGVTRIVNVGADLETSRASVQLSALNQHMYAAVGCHPHDASSFNPAIQDGLQELISPSAKVVAIGEIGLDYFRHCSSPDQQQTVFRRLLDMAKDVGLPVIVHSRDAHEDVLRILRGYEGLLRGVVIHCFSASVELLREVLSRGYYVSFTANITYPKADALREAVADTPMDRLMIETDAPYLAPQNARGSRNEPGYVRAVAEEIARIKGLSLTDVACQTSANAKTFFRLP